jgi:hypothetical protein
LSILPVPRFIPTKMPEASKYQAVGTGPQPIGVILMPSRRLGSYWPGAERSDTPGVLSLSGCTLKGMCVKLRRLLLL